MRQVLTDQKVNMTITAKLMCAIPSFIWNASLLETCWMKLLRQMVIGGWSRLPTPEDAEDTEFRLRCTKTDILHITNKQSQKCDLEPIFKMLVMWFRCTGRPCSRKCNSTVTGWPSGGLELYCNVYPIELQWLGIKSNSFSYIVNNTETENKALGHVSCQEKVVWQNTT